MLKVKVNTADGGKIRSRIQKLMDRNDIDILVGFPSGREHVPTLHKKGKGKKAKYEGYNGESPLDIEPIETSELAKMLSYGTATIPSRPFLKEGIENDITRLKDALKAESEKTVRNQKPNWEKVGTMAAGAVQEFVRGDYYQSTKPNSQRTIEYKGSDKPLIDGGDLIGSLAFIVEEKNK